MLYPSRFDPPQLVDRGFEPGKTFRCVKSAAWPARRAVVASIACGTSKLLIGLSACARLEEASPRERDGLVE